MASRTNVRLTVRGVDQTRAMFARVRANVALMASQVRAAGAAAVSGLATGLAVSTASAIALTTATVAAARAFGRLSDRAAQAGTTADELDRLAAALNAAGAKNADIETVSDALARMTKATGATGVEGFRETLAAIASIGDEGARVQELSRIFGRSFGPSLAAFVRQGPDALREGLDGVMGLLSRVSNRAVAMGDEIADGFDIAKRGVTRAGQTLLVEIAGKVFGGIGKSARAVGVLVSEYASVYGEVALANVDPLWYRIKAAVKNIKPLIKSTLKLVLADVADFVKDAGNWLGLVMTGLAAVHLAMGNVVGAAVVGAGAAALAFGLEALGDAADKARADAEKESEKIKDIFAGAPPFVGLTDKQKKRLADADEKAAEIERHMSKLTDGSAGAALADNLAAALGPVRSTAAVLSGTYEAFKISRYRGLGGSNGGVDARQAASTTAQNTGKMVASLDQLNQTARQACSAFQGLPPVYVLE